MKQITEKQIVEWKAELNVQKQKKLEAEKIIIKWKETNQAINVTIVRPAVVFGEYNFGGDNNVSAYFDMLYSDTFILSKFL